MNCEICFSKYNLSNHKPITLMPCGHTFCLYCVENFKMDNYKCPTCREQVNNQKPNYTVLNIINSSAAQEINFKLKKTINQSFKDLDDTQRRYSLDYLKKIEETKDKFTLIKRKINLKTTELMNVLLSNQEKLLDTVDDIESKYLSELDKVIQTNDNQTLDKLKRFDINKMNQNELFYFKTELDTIKTNLTTKLNQFNDLNFDLDFKENEKFTSLGNQLLGDLIYSEQTTTEILIQHNNKKIKNSNKENILNQENQNRDQESSIRQRSYSSNRSTTSNNVKVKIYSANHEHHFNLIKHSDHDWICDGSKIFGACKANIDSCGKSKGKLRYRCAICPDFDLCQDCLHAPRVEFRKSKVTRN